MTETNPNPPDAEVAAPEDYVFEWVQHGRLNPPSLPAWEKPYQDAGLIEEARRKGYIWIDRDVRCSVQLTPLGEMLVRAMKAEAALSNETKATRSDEALRSALVKARAKLAFVGHSDQKHGCPMCDLLTEIDAALNNPPGASASPRLSGEVDGSRFDGAVTGDLHGHGRRASPEND